MAVRWLATQRGESPLPDPRSGVGCVQLQDLPRGREPILERDAVHVPDVVAELAVEGLVAGADELERRAEIVSLQVGDSEVGHIDTPRRTSDGHAWPRRSAGSAPALSAR